MNDLAEGRCVDWLGVDYWRDYNHFDWEDRVPYRHKFSSPLDIMQSIRGTPSYLGFEKNPFDDDEIFDFIEGINRLNVRFEDWTTARCFWPKPGDIKAPYHFYFFGTTKDMMTIKLLIDHK